MRLVIKLTNDFILHAGPGGSAVSEGRSLPPCVSCKQMLSDPYGGLGPSWQSVDPAWQSPGQGPFCKRARLDLSLAGEVGAGACSCCSLGPPSEVGSSCPGGGRRGLVSRWGEEAGLGWAAGTF